MLIGRRHDRREEGVGNLHVRVAILMYVVKGGGYVYVNEMSTLLRLISFP